MSLKKAIASSGVLRRIGCAFDCHAAVDDYVSFRVLNNEPRHRDLQGYGQRFVHFQAQGFAADTATGEEVEPQ
ncbi:MAG TPA: hypothetical protein VE641_01655 [Chthoniobacterales bacterium]|jgi:hypothetical protein|nr:hypothetical protein [Chthoniobacterales bacterium]